MINFILEIKDLSKYRKKYGFLSKLRNHLDIIHAKCIKEEFEPVSGLQVKGAENNPDLPNLSLEHLYDMLKIIYKIFLDKDFNYYPKNFNKR